MKNKIVVLVSSKNSSSSIESVTFDNATIRLSGDYIIFESHNTELNEITVTPYNLSLIKKYKITKTKTK
jgi:hypothetical protein